MMGAVKRWRGVTVKNHALDERIPSNGDAQGPEGTGTTQGDEDNTNKNRREIEEKAGVDASQTEIFLGTRIHYGPLQIVGRMDPGFLLRGLYFLSGGSGDLFAWVNLIYDWDYDSDVASGNGLIVGGSPSPHKAESKAQAPGVEG
jgi:hypothetical protein